MGCRFIAAIIMIDNAIIHVTPLSDPTDKYLYLRELTSLNTGESTDVALSPRYIYIPIQYQTTHELELLGD